MTLNETPLPLKQRIASAIGSSLKKVRGGYLGKERFSLTYFIYYLLPFFGYDYSRRVEWKFVLNNLSKIKGQKILDAGCTLSLFIYGLSRYGDTFGIDSSGYDENLPANIKFLLADIVRTPFQDGYFDVISCVSVIEHVGLGSYGDPYYSDDADFRAVNELKRILKMNGSLFLTTLIGPKYVITGNGNQRIYDKKRLDKLLNGLRIAKEEYYIFNKRWIRQNKESAFADTSHGFAIACVQAQK